jgi:hypothetical protein
MIINLEEAADCDQAEQHPNKWGKQQRSASTRINIVICRPSKDNIG